MTSNTCTFAYTVPSICSNFWKVSQLSGGSQVTLTSPVTIIDPGGSRTDKVQVYFSQWLTRFMPKPTLSLCTSTVYRYDTALSSTITNLHSGYECVSSSYDAIETSCAPVPVDCFDKAPLATDCPTSLGYTEASVHSATLKVTQYCCPGSV